MWLRPIQVECYAGHKADEAPRQFFWENGWLEVLEVTDRWHHCTPLPEWPRADYFKVRSEDQHIYLIKHDLESDEWYFCQRW